MTESVIRVLLVIDEASVGGGQQHVLWLAERLDRMQFDVAVACEAEGFLVDALAKRKIRHFPVQMRNIPSVKALIRCRNIIKAFHPHIVHTHGGTAGVTGRIAAMLSPAVRMVHTYHGIHYLHDPRPWRRLGFRWLEAVLLKFTDRIICVAQQDVDTGVAAGIVDTRKTVVVENGVDTAVFAGERDYALDMTPVVGTIGRLHMQKGHKFLINAIPAVAAAFPASRFVIIGEGNLFDELTVRAASLGVTDRLFLAGRRTDIAQQLRGMDVFVLPSLWEGLPIALLEAMASGLPIVASGVDGINDILQNGETALLVPAADSGALAEAIVRLLSDGDLRRSLGERARLKVQERFGIDRMIRETMAVYRSMMG